MAFIPSYKHILVNYHYVRNPSADWGGIHPCPVAEFDRQIKFLSENYKIVSIPEVYTSARANARERVCAITFDDGLRDQYENAAPILKKYGAVVIFFVITRTLSGEVPDAHKMHIVNSKMGVMALIDAFNVFLANTHPNFLEQFKIPKDRRITELRKYDDIPNANFKETMTNVPAEIRNSFLDKIFSDLGLNERKISREMFVSIEELRDLKRRGF